MDSMEAARIMMEGSGGGSDVVPVNKLIIASGVYTPNDGEMWNKVNIGTKRYYEKNGYTLQYNWDIYSKYCESKMWARVEIDLGNDYICDVRIPYSITMPSSSNMPIIQDHYFSNNTFSVRYQYVNNEHTDHQDRYFEWVRVSSCTLPFLMIFYKNGISIPLYIAYSTLSNNIESYNREDYGINDIIDDPTYYYYGAVGKIKREYWLATKPNISVYYFRQGSGSILLYASQYWRVHNRTLYGDEIWHDVQTAARSSTMYEPTQYTIIWSSVSTEELMYHIAHIKRSMVQYPFPYKYKTYNSNNEVIQSG